MKSLIIFLMAASSPAFAALSPGEVWECLKRTDPALMKTENTPRATFCHLNEYEVFEMEIGFNVQSKFTCLMSDGTKKEIATGMQCRNMPPGKLLHDNTCNPNDDHMRCSVDGSLCCPLHSTCYGNYPDGTPGIGTCN
jgi:hypothetical protein